MEAESIRQSKMETRKLQELGGCLQRGTNAADPFLTSKSFTMTNRTSWWGKKPEVLRTAEESWYQTHAQAPKVADPNGSESQKGGDALGSAAAGISVE